MHLDWTRSCWIGSITTWPPLDDRTGGGALSAKRKDNHPWMSCPLPLTSKKRGQRGRGQCGHDGRHRYRRLSRWISAE
jgi:hypothetical protein